MSEAIVTLTEWTDWSDWMNDYGVEVRLDLIPALQKEDKLNQWLTKFGRDRTVILTFRPIPGFNRMTLLNKVDWEHVDFLDVELDGDGQYIKDCRSLLEMKQGQVGIIFSCHTVECYDEELPFYSEYLSLRQEGDVYKYAGMGSDHVIANYNQWMNSLVKIESIGKAVCIVMGVNGQFSRTLGLDYGMPWTYVSTSKDSEAAPGQLAVKEWENYIRAKEDWSFHAVVGKPILHSKSPSIFNSFFIKNNIPATYSRWSLDNLDEVNAWRERIPMGFVNVTAPFKKKVGNVLTRTDNSSAYNYYNFRNGQLQNTDVLALREFLSSKVSRVKRLVIFGGGGAAEAAMIANEGMLPVIVAVRDKNKPLNSEVFNDAEIVSLDYKFEFENDLIIWTIPTSVLNDLRLDIGTGVIWMDANYRDNGASHLPLNKLTYYSGLTWLRMQAEPIMEGLGHPLSADEWETVLSERMSADRIALIGLPGAGKSHVGEQLAERMGRVFVDLDDYIENQTGSAISKIFENDGEPRFREHETKYLKEWSTRQDVVVSCGGGIIENGYNRFLLKNNFLVVFLLIEEEVAVRRVMDTDRPMFKGGNAAATMEVLARRRAKHYLEAADLVVDVTNRSINQVVEKLYEEYRQAFQA